MPVAATIRATMPPEGWQIPLFNELSNGYVEVVPNPIWKYLKYIPYSKPTKVHDQIQLYGIAKDLDDFCFKAVNTTSEKLSNMAIEASVWDLDGMCSYYKVHESFTMLPKTVTPIFKMDYPKSEHAKPVYFLLLKLYNKSNNRVL
ncbi:hypothetical protein Ahy_B07g087679 [Arachis hypogaea]|uniref:Uncharacterized protein n=1 Tax=Arachis hypogaea TaxID=3818 RepID=A0A444YCR3_ARAHY|nr:hypothetical protein Ahy_B07g087679 [Arachis hypogaea]